MKKELIIIGAGGFGRIVYDTLSRHVVMCAQFSFKGFLDTRAASELPNLDLPLLGSPLDYKIQTNEIFMPAVGNPSLKKTLVSPIAAQEAAFANYYQEEFIGTRSKIGHGAFFAAGTSVSVDCQVGDFVSIDTHTIIGHDVEIGHHCTIGAMCFLAGGVKLGNEVTVHPHASIAKDVQVGDGAVIGIGAVVVKNVPPNTTVFGNPARVIHAHA